MRGGAFDPPTHDNINIYINVIVHVYTYSTLYIMHTEVYCTLYHLVVCVLIHHVTQGEEKMYIGALYSSVSGLLAFISRAYRQFLSPIPRIILCTSCIDCVLSAFHSGCQADLCIVLGSSLRVSPANLVPEKVLAQGGRVVICK